MCYLFQARIHSKLTRMKPNAGEGQAVDEREVLSNVLGDRRGWSQGVGRKVRNLLPNVSCVSSSQMQQMQEQIR
jgi:hypothetical protein